MPEKFAGGVKMAIFAALKPMKAARQRSGQKRNVAYPSTQELGAAARPSPQYIFNVA